ncbi:hypothetical protein NQ317_012066 [Molorchus minor]|uniref:ADP-ribosylation factor-like protein 2-binding protein n=1 Tax=Molorchus minor TaxID=1323400 RepID=A0ABQ9K5D9_9CUCU|nr:hypothetical protein NQ317_012066 [Molorchus minor]
MTELSEATFEYINTTNVNSDRYFSQIIGCIEEIIMDEEFIHLQNTFMEEYWTEFDNEEENKLIYMDIFKKYIATVEKFIEYRLLQCINSFDMKGKEKMNLDGEIFEILETFSDFEAFKTMFLDYKAMKEGKAIDFSKEVVISKCSIKI